MKKYIVLFIAGLLLISCAKQKSGFDLDYPGKNLQRGEILIIEYQSEGEAPRLFDIMIVGDYGNIQSIEMPNDSTYFRTEITVPDDAIFIRATAVYSNQYAPFAPILIHGKDGKPVKGANSAMAANQNYENKSREYLKRELELYPDNAMAYIDRWLTYMLEGKRSLIKKDMYSIKEMEGPLVDAALAYGLGMIGDADSALFHLERYMQTDNPKWAPRIAMPIRNRLNPELLIDISMANPSHEGAYLISRDILEAGYRSLSFKDLLATIKDENSKGSYLYARYLYSDTTQFLEFMKDYRIPPGDIQMVEPLIHAAEISIALGESAEGFIKNAETIQESIQLTDDVKARLLLLKARGRNPQYITDAMSLGMLAEGIQLSDEMGFNTDSLIEASAEMCQRSPKYRFLDSEENVIMPGNMRTQVLLFFMPQARPEVDPIAPAYPDMDFYALTKAPREYIAKQDLAYQKWETISDTEIFNAFEIYEVPLFIIIDGKGRIRYKGNTLEPAILDILSRN